MYSCISSVSFKRIKEEREIKFINVATDYECIPFWNETNPDLFVIPSELLINNFVEKGINKDILLPIGIPVSSKFFEVEKLNLAHDKDVVLLTSGSMGFGEVYDVVVEILNNIDCYLYVVCGSNEKLKRKIRFN